MPLVLIEYIVFSIDDDCLIENGEVVFCYYFFLSTRYILNEMTMNYLWSTIIMHSFEYIWICDIRHIFCFLFSFCFFFPACLSMFDCLQDMNCTRKQNTHLKMYAQKEALKWRDEITIKKKYERNIFIHVLNQLPRKC